MKISAVKILIAANVLVYLLQGQTAGQLDELFALWAAATHRRPRIFSLLADHYLRIPA
jgi:hypothetical protein